jgi:hypothetical protein
LALILYLFSCRGNFGEPNCGEFFSQHDSIPASPRIQPSSPQLEVSASPRNHPVSPQPDIQEPSLEPEKLPSVIQEARNDVSKNIHLFYFHLIDYYSFGKNFFQEKTVSSPSYSFTVEDLVAEKGDEASSDQALSEENQAKLKEILSLLQRGVLDQVRDADLLREALEFINQDLPADIKASLEPISQLDNHFVAVKQALKNLSSQPALEQRKAAAKQSVKDLYAQMQNHKEFLTKLQPALQLKKARKAALEAELKSLTAEIEADEKKMTELPESMEKI